MEVKLLPLLLGVVNGVEHGGLEPGEGHVQRVVGHVGLGEVESFVIAALGHAVHGAAAGIAQAQHPGGLVKALAGGVIPGGAHDLKMGIVPDIYKGGGAAGHAQAQKGRLQVRVGDVVGGDVAPDVVNGDEGDAQAVGYRLCEGHPYQQRADEARGIGDGHGTDVCLGKAGLPQGLVSKAGDGLHMLAGGDFGHHAAVDGVHVGGGGDDGGQDGAAILHHRGGGLVAGGFEGENVHKVHFLMKRCAPAGAEI